ncbi:Fur family transcriptional regulator [Clostridium sp. BJN0001]|uniref:Fur family transcriptional regulator n=1 Tax=Clostridium sp. BJN0001 TaxID=2930219 RepID=UPI001FD3C608|nr:Fur family transcriptional regulator [Clostridium sp. BJN0001]
MEPVKILKSKQIKVTKARKEVLNLLFESDKSMSAESIYSIFTYKNININLSTVYRTLELFEKKSIIEKIMLQDGVSAYKLIKNAHRHYLQCDICHKKVEIPCPMSQIEEMVEDETGFTLTEHELILKGICSDCKKKKEKF